MKINKIMIKFKNETEIILPKKGIFPYGMVALYSDENNRYKTTIIRSIIKQAFSSSIKMPDLTRGEGGIKNIVIVYERNSSIIKVTWSSNNGIFIEENGHIQNYDDADRSSVFKYLFPNSLIEKDDNVRPSWIMDRFLLDQDFDTRSFSLLPSLYNSDKDTLDNVDFWLQTRRPPNKNITSNKIQLKILKKKLRDIDNNIKILKDITNIKGSLNIEYNEIEIENIKNSEKSIIKQLHNLRSEVVNLNSQINNLELLRNQKLKNTDKDNYIFMIAEDIITNDMIQVKADMNSLLSFTTHPISTNKESLAIEIKQLKASVKRKNSDVSELTKKLEGTIEEMKKIGFTMLSEEGNTLDKWISERQSVAAKINSIDKEIIAFKEETKLFHKDLLKNKSLNKNNAIAFLNKIIGKSSHSGSDTFIEKFAKCISFYMEITAIEYPLLIDSIREKDISNRNLNKLFSELYPIIKTKKTQAFITMTMKRKNAINHEDWSIFFDKNNSKIFLE